MPFGYFYQLLPLYSNFFDSRQSALLAIPTLCQQPSWHSSGLFLHSKRLLLRPKDLYLLMRTALRYMFDVDGSTGTSGGLRVVRLTDPMPLTPTPWASAVYGHTNHQNAAYSQGIRGFATSTSALPTGIGRTYGVYGAACGATEGYNYGVFGILPGTTKGSAVYGTTLTWDGGQTLDQRYAGYFNGPVKVQGNLTVTGNISGVVLGAPSSYSASLLLSEMQGQRSASTTSQLGTLDVCSFYHEPASIPDQTCKTEVHSSDTAEIVFPLTAMEQQVLSKQHYALKADQLEEVFPDLVYENEDGSKSINYVEMVPILVQAINELSAKVAVLEDGNGTVRKVAANAKNADGIGENIQLLSLGQNKPNPFGTSTEIQVSVPESVQKAFVYVSRGYAVNFDLAEARQL